MTCRNLAHQDFQGCRFLSAYELKKIYRSTLLRPAEKVKTHCANTKVWMDQNAMCKSERVKRTCPLRACKRVTTIYAVTLKTFMADLDTIH